MREEQIRPKNLFQKYLDHCQNDIKIYFDKKWLELKCPTCGYGASQDFSKMGFTYVYCNECKNLFASPRPDFKSFESYYTVSNSANFWSKEFLPAVEKERIKFIWQPKAKEVVKLINVYNSSKSIDYIIDIGGSKGLFLREIQKVMPEVGTINIEPNIEATTNLFDMQVIQKSLEDVRIDEVPSAGKVFTCFELFEHVHNPRIFLNHISKLMAKGDILILSTLNSQGIDIRILWDKSPSVNPPFHINFFNLKSMRALGETVNLKTLKSYTPGKLDLDILWNNKEHINNFFIRFFLRLIGIKGRQLVQFILRYTKHSSHMWIVYTKI